MDVAENVDPGTQDAEVHRLNGLLAEFDREMRARWDAIGAEIKLMGYLISVDGKKVVRRLPCRE